MTPRKSRAFRRLGQRYPGWDDPKDRSSGRTGKHSYRVEPGSVWSDERRPDVLAMVEWTNAWGVGGVQWLTGDNPPRPAWYDDVGGDLLKVTVPKWKEPWHVFVQHYLLRINAQPDGLRQERIVYNQNEKRKV